MKVLAIETSGLVSSVAIAENNQILCEYATHYKKTHSVTLMPMIEDMLKITNIDINDIDLVAVSEGPGSFTGLRIGSASAKGMAMALNLKIASVPTLEALAFNIEPTNLLICPMIDARRQQVYTALFAYENNVLNRLTEMMAVPIEDMINIILKHDRGVIFLGDGFEPNEDKIKSMLGERFWQLASPQNRMQRASSVALLGLRYALEGKLTNHDAHVPVYLRKSQAEREKEEKSGL